MTQRILKLCEMVPIMIVVGWVAVRNISERQKTDFGRFYYKEMMGMTVYFKAALKITRGLSLKWYREDRVSLRAIEVFLLQMYSGSGSWGEMSSWDIKGWQIFPSQGIPGPCRFHEQNAWWVFRKNFAIGHRWELERQEASRVLNSKYVPGMGCHCDASLGTVSMTYVRSYVEACRGNLVILVASLWHFPVALHRRCLR